MPKLIDDPEVCLQLLSDAGVNPTTQQCIKDKGYDTIALVAFAIPENSIEEVVRHLTPVPDGGSAILLTIFVCFARDSPQPDIYYPATDAYLPISSSGGGGADGRVPTDRSPQPVTSSRLP